MTVDERPPLRKSRWLPSELLPLKRQRLLGKNFSVFDLETERWPDDCSVLTQKEIDFWDQHHIEIFLATHYNGYETPVNHIGEDCVKKFLTSYLQHRYRFPHICFAHNGGKFDMLSVFYLIQNDHWFQTNGYTADIPFLVNGRILSLKIRDKNKHCWVFRDSFSLLPESLEDLCNGFKPDVMKWDKKHVEALFKTDFYDNQEEWIQYCNNDCISLHQILCKFDDTIKEIGGSIGVTASSTGMRSFRYGFQKHPIATYYEYNDRFRNAYYGGRCEIFSQMMLEDDGPWYVGDINSMYPYVMRNYKFPVGKPYKVDYTMGSDCRGKVGIMKCKVYAPENLNVPFLPLHAPDGKLLFPIGEWEGWYDFCEIEKALKLGYLIDPLITYEFEGAYIFKDFIDSLYKIKMENADNAKGRVAKLLMNSTYGKFGEKEEREEFVTEGDLAGLIVGDFYYGYALRKYRQRCSYHLTAIPVRVTAGARVTLYELMEDIGIKTVTYCDTDSVITNKRFPSSKELGGVKLEFDFRRGIALAPKFYYLESYEPIKRLKNVACKGFSRSFKAKMTFEMLEEALLTGDKSKCTEQVIHPETWKIGAQHQSNALSTIVTTRTVNEDYSKRHVNPDFSTRPLRYPDDILKEVRAIAHTNDP